jgi:hypothetical protein
MHCLYSSACIALRPPDQHFDAYFCVLSQLSQPQSPSTARLLSLMAVSALNHLTHCQAYGVSVRRLAESLSCAQHTLMAPSDS